VTANPIETLRRAARVVHTVGFPAVTAQFLAAEYRGLAASCGRLDGNWSEYSTVVASAREVLALAEQQQAHDDPAERGWEFRVSPDRRHIAIWDPGNQPWFVPTRSMDGWWRRDNEVEDWQRFVPVQNGNEVK